MYRYNEKSQISMWFPEVHQLEAAKAFAWKKHRGQRLKGTKFPYVIHLEEVDALLCGTTGDLNVRQAGMLHDVVEDRGVSIDDIHHFFGRHVAGYVKEVTEPERTRPWRERKYEKIQRIPNMMNGSILIMAADATSNMRRLTWGLRKHGPKYFRYFHGSPDEMMNRYHTVTRALLLRLMNSSLTGEQHLVTQLINAQDELMRMSLRLVMR